MRNVIAYQCPRGEGYHVMDPSVVVEVLNEDGRRSPVNPERLSSPACTRGPPL